MAPPMRVTVALAAALVVAACGDDRWAPEELAYGQQRPEQGLELGKQVYADYCIGCHGEKGDGAGPAARFLDPKPRDFRLGRVKFAAVAAGSMPRDEDLLQTVTHGLHGTAMPEFRLLPLAERRAVVAYLKTFSAAWAKAPGAAIALGNDPWRKNPEAGRALGEQLYHGLASCWNCHPAYVEPARLADYQVAAGLTATGGREQLYEPVVKESDWGVAIRPPDFLVDRIKTGSEPESLAQVIGAGIGGTAMPSWAASLPAAQVWGIAYYVRSLAAVRDSAEGRALRAKLLGAPAYVPPAQPQEVTP